MSSLDQCLRAGKLIIVTGVQKQEVLPLPPKSHWSQVAPSGAFAHECVLLNVTMDPVLAVWGLVALMVAFEGSARAGGSQGVRQGRDTGKYSVPSEGNPSHTQGQQSLVPAAGTARGDRWVPLRAEATPGRTGRASHSGCSESGWVNVRFWDVHKTSFKFQPKPELKHGFVHMAGFLFL